MKNYKIGDRITAYFFDEELHKVIGTIHCIEKNGGISILTETDTSGYFPAGKISKDWHPKQCRKLRPLPNKKLITCGKYTISSFKNHEGRQDIWIGKEGGEGMGMSEDTLDKIWEEYF